MFDSVAIYKEWLPSYAYMNIKSAWQTKDLSNVLQVIYIDKDGIVSTKENEYDCLPIDWGRFTRTIEIHTYENEQYYSLLLDIENGELKQVRENIE